MQPRLARLAGFAVVVLCSFGESAWGADSSASPAVVEAVKPSHLPTLFIAGDSTAARGAGDDQQGWGVPFASFFDPSKVTVANRARGGRSSRTFITEGLWDQLLAEVKKGDVVLIQFGHNDGGPVNDDSRARGSIRGLGEETEEIDNLLTKKHEVVHTYGWYLRKMIGDTRSKGATPILLSLTIRNIWNDGLVERGSGRYSTWAKEIARTARVPFVDLTELVADRFDQLGEEKVKGFYVRDHTHFNAEGADLHAAMVVAGLKGLRPSPVQGFLSAKGELVQAENYTRLNLPRPANRALPTLFLIGDSTVRNGYGDGAGGQWGWGDYLGQQMDTNRLNVCNRAVGGLSSRTFLTQGYWDRIMPMIKPGDYVMMQFGHNDNGPITGRNSLRGIGDETQEIEIAAAGRTETVHTYGWYMGRYIEETRARGATPIVCSLVPRKIWANGKIVRAKETHAGWAEQIARAKGVLFIDLNEIVARHYDELGPGKVDSLFADEHTHTTEAGAILNAASVIEGLKALETDPLESFLRSPGTP